MPPITRRAAARLIALGGGALAGGFDPVSPAWGGTSSTRDAPAPSVSKMIDVIGREGWGARPPAGLFHPHRLQRMTVHHSASWAAGPASAPERIRGYQRLHQGQRGWADIAYHFLIDPGGNVYEGRPVFVRGDTATSYDPEGHFLVCLDGDFDRQSPTSEQVGSLIDVLAWASLTYRLQPAEITGHGDWANTSCPGRQVRARLGAIRRDVLEVLATRRPSLMYLDPEQSAARVGRIAGIDIPGSAI